MCGQILVRRITVPFTYEEAFSGTRLESWFHKWRGVHDELTKSSAKGDGNIRTALSHLSDALRLALLWKYAGTYLDTDIITLRDDILRLPNAVGYQKPFGTDYLNGACFNVIIPHHPFIKAVCCMENFDQNQCFKTQTMALHT